jgi:hypothetical protein
MKLASITWSDKFNPIAKGWIILFRTPQKVKHERREKGRTKANCEKFEFENFVSTFFGWIHHNTNLCTSPEGVARNDLLKSYLNANFWCRSQGTTWQTRWDLESKFWQKVAVDRAETLTNDCTQFSDPITTIASCSILNDVNKQKSVHLSVFSSIWRKFACLIITKSLAAG